MKIKKFFLLLVCLFNFSILCHSKSIIPEVPWEIKFPEETTKTKDEAYLAPSSKLEGIWITKDSKRMMIIKKDGSFYCKSLLDQYWKNDNYYVTVDGLSFEGTWTKHGNEFECKPNYKTISMFYDEEDYNRLSERLKADFNKWFKRATETARSTQNNKEINYIVYIDDNFLGLASSLNSSWSQVDWFIKERHLKDRSEALLKERQEKTDWDMALQTNRIEAYQDFINKYPNSSHVAEAKTKILEQMPAREWEGIKNSNKSSDIGNFITKYPKFENIIEALDRYYSLLGMEYYDNGQQQLAIEAFQKVNQKDQIPPVAQNAFKSLKPIMEFQSLSENSSVYLLKNYLKKYPYSPYNDKVKNFLAIALLKQFNYNSTQKDYDEALEYASGDKIQLVKNAIQKNEEKLRLRNKEEMRREREAKGGNFGLYIEFADISWNGRITNGILNYNLGLKFKINNQQDRFQFAIGVLPGLGMWDFKEKYNPKDSDEKEEKYKTSKFFQMPIEAEAKINLAKTGPDSWFFFDARISYNAIRKQQLQAPMGFRAGLGFGSQNLDFLFFYGRPIGNIAGKDDIINGYQNPFKNAENKNYIGLSIGYIIPFNTINKN